MAVAVKKYNPGFLTDDEIAGSFCVRTAEFDSLVESLRESGAGSSPHSLVIGPRGSGKTHLLLRVAAEVRRNPALTGLSPVAFAEESYEVATCGEFWLECLGRLAEQAPNEERNNLRLTYQELRTVTDDQALADRCLGSLLDYADRHDTRLVLIVENLNMLFADIGDPDVGWRLRQTLQTEPRIILLASATSRFDEIDNPDHALYDLFRVITLRPLDTAECTTLWQSVAGKSSTTEAVRPLEILTGGNPRLLTIIARFGADRSFRNLMENLLDLVDEHTEYFKSHLETLPPQERRVYLALARLWKPSTTREIADLARLNTSTCSAQLKRLVQRGAVTPEGGTPRRRQYYLTERLYNIYYLMRLGRGTDHLVNALGEFMICLYSQKELVEIIGDFYKDARNSGSLTPDVAGQMASALVRHAMSFHTAGMLDEALKLYNRVIEPLNSDADSMIDVQVAAALVAKSTLLIQTGRDQEAMSTCDYLLQRFGTRDDQPFPIALASAWSDKARILAKQDESKAAIHAFDQAATHVDRLEIPELRELRAAIYWGRGAQLYQEGNHVAARDSFDRVVRQYPLPSVPHVDETLAYALTCKTFLLYEICEAIEVDEFVLFLKSLAEIGSLTPGSVEALIVFIASVEPTRALDLLETSDAAPLLTPLITVIQQELRQTPKVAREVTEVASDVRIKLAEARAALAQVRGPNQAS